MKKLSGASTEFFYCYNHDEASFDLKFSVTFKERIALDALKQALNEAMRLYPELSVRPVIKENQVISVPNDRELVILDGFDGIRHYGTADTNGYLLYFVCEEKKLTVSFFHGLTDAVGMMAYLKTALILYARATGKGDFDEAFLQGVRLPEAPQLNPDRADMFDPYRKYGNSEAVSEWRFENPGALTIPMALYPPETNHVHEFSIYISTSAFLALTKKLGVSFAPLMIDIAAETAFAHYDSGEKVFVSMLPVNLRPFFGSSTYVNFSDGITAPVFRADLGLDISQRCRKLKETMTRQMTKAGFESVIAAKTALVDRYLADRSDILSRTLPAPSGGKSSFSLPISYPGRLSFGGALDDLLTDSFITGYSRVSSFVVNTFGDKMEFSVTWRSEDISYLEYFCDSLKHYGFTPVLADKGQVGRDLLTLDRLERL